MSIETDDDALMPEPVQRKLTTILAADAEGYSRVMEADEVGAFEALHASRDIFNKFIDRHRGRIANTAGDGLIAEFPSVVEAVQCAIEVQRELGGGASTPGGALRFRIGVHLGDVIVDGDDLLGEGVNLAARLQTMANPGGILISQQVYDQVHGKLSVGFEYLGEKRPKNFSEDVAVYGVSLGKAKHGIFKGPARHHPSPPPENGVAAADDLRQRVVLRSKLAGALWIMLLAVNLTTGGPLWALWPGLALLAILGLQAAPLFAHGRFDLLQVRSAMLVGLLALINLFTWSGYAWFLWPAAAIGALELFRRFAGRS